MKLINTSFIEEKKSKFYGYIYEINNLEEIKIILDSLKKDHKNFKHAPYAYKFNNTAGKTDDKEPNNTAGIQILNVLIRNNLNNHLIVIIRYYGGIKLGASLLLRSYNKAANLCIK
ncbi:MAG: YigZ family protein [Bacilli bacterium]|nr:YigZ family protein [Bacilli bacterium]MDD4407052.1 YigZ family protein [Bacilli bacterium]